MKFKLNWGWSIVIAMVAFICFIMYFFVITLIDKEKYDHEFVVEDYYGQEMNFQNQLDIERRTLAEGMQVAIFYEKGKGVTLTFPEQATDVIGIVSFYRPSDQKLDFNEAITELSDRKFIVPDEKIVEGVWYITVDYVSNGKDYLTKFNKIKY